MAETSATAGPGVGAPPVERSQEPPVQTPAPVEKPPEQSDSPKGKAVKAIGDGRQLLGLPKSENSEEVSVDLMQGLEELSQAPTTDDNRDKQNQARVLIGSPDNPGGELGQHLEVVGPNGESMSYKDYINALRDFRDNLPSARGRLEEIGVDPDNPKVTYRLNPRLTADSTSGQEKSQSGEGKKKRNKDEEADLRRREDVNTRTTKAQEDLNETTAEIEKLEGKDDTEGEIDILQGELDQIMHTKLDERSPDWEKRADELRTQISAGRRRLEELKTTQKRQETILRELQARQAVWTELDRLRNQLRNGEVEDKRAAQEAIRLLEMAVYASDSNTGRALVQLSLRVSQGIGGESSLPQELRDHLGDPSNRVSSASVFSELAKGQDMADPKVRSAVTELAEALTSDNPAKLGEVLQKYPEIAKDDKFSKAIFGTASNERAYMRHVLKPYGINGIILRRKMEESGFGALGIFAFLTYDLFIQPGFENFEPVESGQ